MRQGRNVGARRKRLFDSPFLAPGLAEPKLQSGPDFGGGGNPIIRAYQLYEQRGRIEGHALDDWLQAEAEILGNRGQPKNVRRRKPK